MLETPLPSLGLEDPLEKEIANHSSILARKSHGQRSLVDCSPWLAELGTTEPVDGGAWWAAVHAVAKSRTRLSDFTFTSHFHALEKEMATHSSVLAWRIPRTGGPWPAIVLGSQKSQIRLSNFTFTSHFHALEKEMAPHSSVLAWRIPGTGKPGGLPSMGSHRVGHD